ncbi:hypothetical protein ACLB2K_014279 [Fragaria x ananassa]
MLYIIFRKRNRYYNLMAAEDRKLYGDLNTPETLKVLACLFEHDLDFEFVPINLEANQHREKHFLSMSPFGKLPVLEDPDVTLFEESGRRAYLLESHKQALVANWIDVKDHYFEPPGPALKLISLLSSNKAIDDVGESDGVDHEIAELSQVLDVYEAQLGRFKYLASDKFTVADVLHLPNLHSLMGIASTKKLIDSRPHVSAWCSEILARPSWTKVLQMKKQKMISQA